MPQDQEEELVEGTKFNIFVAFVNSNSDIYSAEETKDEPFAWEAREFLRKKLIGKEVVFTVEYKVPSSGREYGFLYLGKGTY